MTLPLMVRLLWWFGTRIARFGHRLTDRGDARYAAWVLQLNRRGA